MGTESDLSNVLEMPRWYKKLLVPSVRNRDGHAFLLTGETTVLNTDAAIKAGDICHPLEKLLLAALSTRPILVLFNTQGEMEIKLTDEAQSQFSAMKHVDSLRHSKTLSQRMVHARHLLDEGERVAVVVMEVDEATASPRCSEREAEYIWKSIHDAAKSTDARRNGALLLLQSSQRDLPKTSTTSIRRMGTELGNHIECIQVERPTFEERLRCFKLCLPAEDESFFQRFALDSHGWPLDKLSTMLQTAQRSTKPAGARETVLKHLHAYEEGLVHKTFFVDRPSIPTRTSTLIHGHPHVTRYTQTLRELIEATPRHQPHLLRIVGMPGNGKTLVAEAVASALGAQFVRLKPNALHGTLDTLDRRVQLRDTLIALAPVVVFANENVHLLQALFQSYRLSAPIVIVSAISSLPPLRDGAFMQGMHECLVIPPLSQEERCDVIEAFRRDHGQEQLDEPTLEAIGQRMRGYTFSEICQALAIPWVLTPSSPSSANEMLLPPPKTDLVTSDMLTLYGLLWTQNVEHFPRHPHTLISASLRRANEQLKPADRDRFVNLLKRFT